MYFYFKKDDGKQKNRQSKDFGDISNIQTDVNIDSEKWDKIFHNWDHPEKCAGKQKPQGCKICDKLMNMEYVVNNNTIYNTTILIVGDIHGQLNRVKELAEQFKINTVISTGDLEIYTSLEEISSDKKAVKNRSDNLLKNYTSINKNILQPLSFKLFCVKGNHDVYSTESIKQLETYNIFYPENGKSGGLITVNGANILVFGGIFSKNNFNAYPEELEDTKKKYFTQNEINSILEKMNNTNIDLLITHQVAENIIENTGHIKHEEGNKNLNVLLDNLNPNIYIHGHHHITYKKNYINSNNKIINVFGLGNLSSNPNSYILYETLSKKVIQSC